jgi:sulfoxide reductase heme-binding subunit YedZ
VIWPWQDRAHGFSPVKAFFFALMFAPGLWLTYQVANEAFGMFPLAGMTYWSGVWAMALLLAALAVTPLMAIARWKRLTLVRRMIGVTALVYTVAHIVIWFALRMWDFGFLANELVTRFTLIVATVATIALIPLGVTSVDAMVRRMGSEGWQRLHNTVYATTALALFHYLLSPGVYPEQYLMSGMFFWLMVWRALAKRGLGTHPITLAVLAVVTCAFTIVFEVLWTWVYQDFEPAQTFRNNFAMLYGVPPSWKILVLGLLLALVAAVRRRPVPARA